MTPQQKKQLIEATQAAGAGGIILLRGAKRIEVLYEDDAGEDRMIEIAPAQMVGIFRFEDGDGGEPGIEFWGEGEKDG